MRRKYKWPAMILVLLLCLCAGLFAKTNVRAAAADAGKPWLEDNAGLFSEDERRELLGRLHQVREEQSIDAVIITVNDTAGKTPRAFADDYLAEGGYGCGLEKNAIALLIDMGNREIYISTMGTTALKSFSDARIEKMLDAVADALEDENYGKAARVFIRDVQRYMNVDPQVRVKAPLTVGAVVWRIGISAAVGTLIALIVWLVLRRGTPVTVSAGDYLVENTVRITGQEDTFINTVTTSRRIERESSGNGGTTTHRSSSGTTHGGGGRSF